MRKENIMPNYPTLLDSDYEENEYMLEKQLEKQKEHLLHPHKKPPFPPSNKSVGSAFERELAEILSRHGFWAHVMASKATGQPADVIAVRNGRAYLIDAKECAHNTFPLSRVESNQHTAMTLWEECGNGTPWFALKLHGADGSAEDGSAEVLMVPYSAMEEYAMLSDKKSMDEKDIRFEGYPLDDWVEVMA